jgi:hypothetical protein
MRSVSNIITQIQASASFQLVSKKIIVCLLLLVVHAAIDCKYYHILTLALPRHLQHHFNNGQKCNRAKRATSRIIAGTL